MNILIIILILTVIALCIWVWVLKRKKSEVECEGGGEINQQVQQKNLRKEDILKYLKEKRVITNDEVQGLVGVSDSSATSYLQELEDEGLVEQKGKTGHAVYYTLK